MDIAFDSTPVSSAHNVRGVGSYTVNLLHSLKSIEKVNILEFKIEEKIPAADIVHYPYFDFFFHTLPIGFRIPRVVTIHDVIPLIFPKQFPVGLKGRLNFNLQKLSLKNTQAVICVSEASKKDIISKLNYPENKIFSIHLSAGKNFKQISDAKILEKAASNYNLSEKFALYVGDVNWNKNIPKLMEAIQISGKNLVIVGKAAADTKLKETQEIRQKIKFLGIEKAVKFLGFVPEEDLVALYNLAQVTVLPSLYEGFGLAVLESMACGTPVVCSQNSSLGEIGGDAAVFCDPYSANDISQKIDSVFQLDSKKRQELQQKSLKNASLYSWEKTARETFKVYESILE